MTELSSTDALRAELSRLGATVALDRLGLLREKVHAVVDELKAARMAPEHAVMAVKGIVYEANTRLSESRLVEQLVQWTVERYFTESSG